MLAGVSAFFVVKASAGLRAQVDAVTSVFRISRLAWHKPNPIICAIQTTRCRNDHSAFFSW
jgi:hypothetical protein